MAIFCGIPSFVVVVPSLFVQHRAGHVPRRSLKYSTAPGWAHQIKHLWDLRDWLPSIEAKEIMTWKNACRILMLDSYDHTTDIYWCFMFLAQTFMAILGYTAFSLFPPWICLLCTPCATKKNSSSEQGPTLVAPCSKRPVEMTSWRLPEAQSMRWV